MNQYLAIGQIIVAIFLIISILLQKRGEGLGAAFGGGGGFYATRRGLEKKIFWLTIIFAIIFIALALLNLIL
jgi:protein translocase SecG subunit